MTERDLIRTCTLCPRLCRDTCPVAVHAGRDDFVPSEKMRSAAGALGLAEGLVDDERLRACTDCGACTAFCLFHVPVAAILAQADADRVRRGLAAPAAPPPAAPPAPAWDGHGPAAALEVCTGAPLPAAPERVEVPLGSACCGQRLSPEVGDPELRDRMARGMLAAVPDGATVVVGDPACAAHLARACRGRVRVLAG